VDEVLDAIVSVLRVGPAVVVRAPTGAGKTTRVPPALLDAGLAGHRQVIVVEPRRVAARAAARRMAAERGTRLGDEIGYHVRFDRCAGPSSRLVVMTPGVLLQLVHADPFLERAGVVVFDEFHERGLDGDLALGLARLIQQSVRPELRVVAMSATLAAQRVAEYLGGCPVVASEGRQFPVDVVYEPRAGAAPWPDAAAEAAGRLLRRTDGDLLVFLPGWQEIRQTARALESLATARNLAVMPMHGDLSPAEQDAVLGRSDRRKVILSTNVAETSVTIDGVTGVVDTGLARELSYDAGVGLDRLSVVNVSKASAEQRAGRAGRTAPGICIRLWSESSHRTRPDQTEPEVRRVDLAGSVLLLLALGERDLVRFPWVEPPPADAVTRALTLLRALDAIDGLSVTDVGRQLVRLPVHPRLGRMLLEGSRLGQPGPVALAAALLAERDPFRRLTARPRPASESDVLDRVEALEQFERDGRFETPLGELDGAAARFVLRARDQLYRAVDASGAPPPESRDAAVLRSLVVAFADRVCRRRNPGGRKGVMVGGRGVRLDGRSAVTRPALFVAVDVDAGGDESNVRIASAARREWLPRRELTESLDVEFDEASGRVVARRRTRFGDLVIDDAEAPPPAGAPAARALAAAARARPQRVLPGDDSPAARLRTRVRCLAAWRPDLGLPDLHDDGFLELIDWLAPACRSLGELRDADWLGALRGRLTNDQLRAVDREAPETWVLPSGRTVALAYAVGRPPVLAARIQEMFGLRDTPCVAGGRVPVLLHLLAPNDRPQQVTSDLASFWVNTYPLVRKELRARYPKHAWPDDPLAAEPQSRPRRRA
jgi:ATP-dependent helicase HrpB